MIIMNESNINLLIILNEFKNVLVTHMRMKNFVF